MKTVSENELEDLVLKLFNENRLIAVLNHLKCIIYRNESDIVELTINSTYMAMCPIINEIAELLQKIPSFNKIFHEPNEAVIVLNNINQKMIDKGYLKLDIDDNNLHDSDIVDIALIFSNPPLFSDITTIILIGYEYLTPNIIKLFPLEVIKRAIFVKNQLKNNYLSLLNANFSFVDERIKDLTDEEKLYLKI